jgi:hypothetical protein
MSKLSSKQPAAATEVQAHHYLLSDHFFRATDFDSRQNWGQVLDSFRAYA